MISRGTSEVVLHDAFKKFDINLLHIAAFATQRLKIYTQYARFFYKFQ